MIAKAINLFLGGADSIGNPVRVSQFDTLWQFVFSIYEGGERWTIPDGAQAVLCGGKPDGTVFTYEGTISNNKVVVDCGEQMTPVPGTVECELKFYVLDLIVATANFRLLVERSPLEDGTASASDISDLQRVVNGAGTVAAEWLSENVSFIEPTVLDKSFEVTGAAAESRTVGIELKSIAKAVNVPRTLASDFESGGLSEMGAPTTNAARARTFYFSLPASPVWKFKLDSTDYAIVNAFKYPGQSSTGYERILKSTDVGVTGDHFALIAYDPDKPYVRFSFKRVDGADIASGELATIKAAFKITKYTDDSLSLSGSAADAKAAGDAIAAGLARTAEVSQVFSLNEPVSLVEPGGLDNTGQKTVNAARARTDFITFTAPQVRRIRIDNTGRDTGKEFYIVNAFKYPADGVANYERIVPASLSSDGYFIYAGDAAKPRVRMSFAKADGSNVTDADLTALRSSLLKIERIAPDNVPLDEVQRLGLHTVPKSRGVLNAIKNARQMTDIRWTPAAQIGRVCHMENHIWFEDRFDAGTEYTGLPYSQTPSEHNIGVNYDFGTFVTAAANAASAEALDSAVSGDAKASYYGVVCAHLISWAFNMPPVQCSDIDDVPYFSEQFAVSAANISGLELGDILWTAPHVALVTDIEYKDGEVYRVEVSENTRARVYTNKTLGGQYGGKSIRKFWTLDDFLTAWDGYTVYRYDEIDSAEYTPSDYVSVGEGEKFPIIEYPLVPYEGNRCWYKNTGTGNKDVTLLINADGFNSVIVTKKNKSGTTTLEPITITSETESVVISCPNDDAVYTAYLKNSSNQTSVPCSWMILGGKLKNPVVTRNLSVVTVNIYRKGNIFVPTAVQLAYTGEVQYQVAKIYDLTVAEETVEGVSGYHYTFKFKSPFTFDQLSELYPLRLYGKNGEDAEFGHSTWML